MFYKKINNDWFCGVEIILPTQPETRLDENNTENSYGWEWHAEPPQEYLDWLEEQENENNDIRE